jgi:predicted RNA binding protein YcfA (HicA-like mRNA interferase family)
MARTVSGRRFCRALERHGWKRVKGTGGHQKYRHPDSDQLIVVPVHGNRDLKRALLQALLKQSGLRLEDL